jgi:signal transduction histidine kinase
VTEGLAGYDDHPDGVVVADATGTVVVFNRAAEQITGMSAAAVLGKELEDALPLEGLDGRAWWPCARPYDGLRSVTGHPERNLILPGGQEVLVTSRYVRQQHRGPVTSVVVAVRGTRHRAREELSRAELVSTVAHELRSPLTSVKGFTATLLAKWDRFNDDQKRLMLETVNADADRVTRLITELLDVSRIEAGRIEVHRQLVDIPHRVEKIVAGRVAAGDPPGRFRIEVPRDLPETWLDADKVDQIIGNLVENAVRHGAGTVTIVVQPADSLAPRAPGRPAGSGTAGAPAVAVSVRDEGDGVPPEMVPPIFRQFWRAKRRGGAGLGLYIVKGLVEAHGGAITVQRAPGGGAEFRFTMPAGLPDFG